MQVSKELLINYDGSINPRILNLKWCLSGEPHILEEKIILSGSEDSKFLLLCQPTTPIRGNFEAIMLTK